MKLDFLVPGKPIPQGSLKAVTVPKLKYTVLVSDNPQLKSWRKKVRNAAIAAMRNAGLTIADKDTPLILQAQCCFKRPKTVTREIQEYAMKCQHEAQEAEDKAGDVESLYAELRRYFGQDCNSVWLAGDRYKSVLNRLSDLEGAGRKVG